MKIKDLVFTKKEQGYSDILYSANTDYGRITILDRLTGYSGNIRDIETGFCDKEDLFWLASGMFDIRNYPELTIEEAIQKIKDNANNCKGI